MKEIKLNIVVDIPEDENKVKEIIEEALKKYKIGANVRIVDVALYKSRRS